MDHISNGNCERSIRRSWLQKMTLVSQSRIPRYAFGGGLNPDCGKFKSLLQWINGVAITWRGEDPCTLYLNVKHESQQQPQALLRVLLPPVESADMTKQQRVESQISDHISNSRGEMEAYLDIFSWTQGYFVWECFLTTRWARRYQQSVDRN